MKKLLKRPTTYMLLIVMVAAVFAGTFLYDYYEIYLMAKNPPSEEVGDRVDNPFDNMGNLDEESIYAENELASGLEEDKNNLKQDSNKESYVQITGVYKEKFARLQKVQEDRLDELIAEGRREYANGASKIKLAAKYLNLANKMESQAEREFEQLKEELKNKLAKNSYDTSIVNNLDSYYSYKKKEVKSEIMAKVNNGI